MPTVPDKKPKKLVGQESAPTTNQSGKKSSNKKTERPIQWDKVSVQLCVGEKSISAELAKKLLGWQEESENIKFGNDYLLRIGAKPGAEEGESEGGGRKIRCNNNVTNRPLYRISVDTLKQDILNGRWKLNGEPIIVGKTGLILNGQHQLVALVEAVEDWQAAKDKLDDRYEEVWPEPPTVNKLVVFGIEEDDATVNTMDTCKPRTLADVIYRSEYFKKYGSGDRKALARMTDYAIRVLWERTGAALDAYAPRRTHAESLAFLGAHPKILECVKHIREEEGTEQRLSKFVNLGIASGLLYLMGCCTSLYDERDEKTGEPTGYMYDPRETSLDWEMWQRACEFWATLAGGREQLPTVLRQAYSEIEGGPSNREKIAFLIKSWNLFASEDEVTEDLIALEYADDNGITRLAENPKVGGIDVHSS